MSSLGYGMYGFNTLNVNGETSQLPMCRMSTALSQSAAGVAMYFNEVVDEYGMCIPNQGASAGTFSAVRTPIAGLYAIEACFEVVGSVGAGNFDCYISLDNACNFGATGIFVASGTPGMFRRSTTANGAIITITVNAKLFIEKDTYVSLYINGTNSAVYSENSNYFSVQCISAENSGKFSWQ